jgi:hypothetical protein
MVKVFSVTAWNEPAAFVRANSALRGASCRRSRPAVNEILPVTCWLNAVLPPVTVRNSDWRIKPLPKSDCNRRL